MQKPQIFAPNTSNQILADFYQQEGYLVIKDFYQYEECQALINRMREMVQECDINELGGVFSAGPKSQGKLVQDQYFRESADKIRFFLEKDAKFTKDAQPEQLLEKFNKTAHALHDLDPVFSQFSRKPELAQLSETLGIAEPLLIQSMYIFKPPRIGGEVRCHQDSTYMYTEPDSLLGFWIPLEDANLNNGCLWVEPGSHREPLRERFHYRGDQLVVDVLDSTPMSEASVPLEISAGTLVVLHGRLAHRSCANTSDKSRHAYTLHIIDGRSEYPPDNWLQRSKDMPFRGF